MLHLLCIPKIYEYCFTKALFDDEYCYSRRADMTLLLYRCVCVCVFVCLLVCLFV
jgi:hypothetical protein